MLQLLLLLLMSDGIHEKQFILRNQCTECEGIPLKLKIQYGDVVLYDRNLEWRDGGSDWFELKKYQKEGLLRVEINGSKKELLLDEDDQCILIEILSDTLEEGIKLGTIYLFNFKACPEFCN